MGTPHPHRDMIHAWADGEDIEYKVPGDTTWRTSETPCFDPDYQYRIKPRTVKREGWGNIYRAPGGGDSRIAYFVYATEAAAKTFAGDGLVATVKIEWSEEE